jgi:hypothetical protein
MTGSKTVQRGLFAAAMTAALGFGAMEALAAPGAAKTAGAYCTATWAAKCNDICVGKGYDYGVCQEPGSCVCVREPLEK